MLVLMLPRRVASLRFSCGLAVSMGEAAKAFLFEGVKAGCNMLKCFFAWQARHFLTFQPV